MVLSYAYHCCEFMPLMEGGAEEVGAGAAGGEDEDEAPTDFVIVPGAHADLAAWANGTDLWAHRECPPRGGRGLVSVVCRTDRACVCVCVAVNASGADEAGLAALLAGWGAGRGVSEPRRTRVQCLPLPGK